jgi:hypothetical protein
MAIFRGFIGLGNFPLQGHTQQTIGERRVFDPDMVGQLELALEATGGNAPMQVLSVLRLGLLAFDDQDVAFLGDIEIFLTEAGDRHFDAIVVLAGLDDVIERPAIDGVETLCVVEEIEDAIVARVTCRRSVSCGHTFVHF